MRAAAKPPAARKAATDQQQSALAAVVERIEQEGDAFVGEDPACARCHRAGGLRP